VSARTAPAFFFAAGFFAAGFFVAGFFVVARFAAFLVAGFVARGPWAAVVALGFSAAVRFAPDFAAALGFVDRPIGSSPPSASSVDQADRD
jgi:hypothetical protein